MNYEPIFKFAEYNVFLADLFVRSYSQYDPIVTIKNGKAEIFISSQKFAELSEIGYNWALNEDYKDFENKALVTRHNLGKMGGENFEKLSNSELILFMDRLLKNLICFQSFYSRIEFPYFTRIEKEIGEFIAGKYSFEDLLSNRINLDDWSKNYRILAENIIGVQHLKIELRKTINELTIGPNSFLTRFFIELIKRTGTESVANMSFNEIKNALKGNIKDVLDRLAYSFIYIENNKLIIISGTNAYKKIKEFDKNIPKNEVIGTPASRGCVTGKVKVIPYSFNPQQYFSKFEKGDILVSDTTGPEMTVLMEKAIAIVTDEGGMMSHAAVISREFNIPCVVGTSYATEVFKDGDLIEVNANSGVVRKIDAL